MSPDEKFVKAPEELEEPSLDQTLQHALRDFRLSIHAFSEAAYNRPRPGFETAPQRKAWRSATAWAMGCVLAVGVAGGGIHERRHQQELARIAAIRDADHQRQLAEQRALEIEDLLAKVDRDVSRQVPNAMEPLAQLMAEDESQ